jgi:hypothetical protein
MTLLDAQGDAMKRAPTMEEVAHGLIVTVMRFPNFTEHLADVHSQLLAQGTTGAELEPRQRLLLRVLKATADFQKAAREIRETSDRLDEKEKAAAEAAAEAAAQELADQVAGSMSEPKAEPEDNGKE